MASSPNLIFIFLGRGLKKSEYSSNSKLHDFKLDTCGRGMGLVNFILFYFIIIIFGWKNFSIWCNLFLRKLSNISINFFPKIYKKITMFLHIVQASSQHIKGF